jgi:hypothetical protein
MYNSSLLVWLGNFLANVEYRRKSCSYNVGEIDYRFRRWSLLFFVGSRQSLDVVENKPSCAKKPGKEREGVFGTNPDEGFLTYHLRLRNSWVVGGKMGVE